MGQMSIMSAKEGDIKVTWDSDKPAEVESARRQFNELVGKGYAAFSVDRRGNRGEQIRSFDPDAEAIILHEQLRGG